MKLRRRDDMAHLTRMLQRRSPVVHPLSPERTVADAVTVMSEHMVGAVLIVEGDELIGIFSERDLLRRVIARGRAPEKVRLRDVMTPEPVTSTPGESRLVALHKMRLAGCRHLPIRAADDGVIIDMLSLRDLLLDELDEREAEVEDLKRYIQGHS
jgi:CBS domain-containing protein